MPLYFVSIEPIYSQSVGNYVYLCDSEEKVTNFRMLLRKVGMSSREDWAIENSARSTRRPMSDENDTKGDEIEDADKEEMEEEDADEEEDDDDDDEDCNDEGSDSGWSFCESVWLIEEEDMRTGRQTGRYRAKKVLREEYLGFRWLKYKMVPLNGLGLMYDAPWDEEDIPQLDCVHDHVECTPNIPFDTFCRIFH